MRKVNDGEKREEKKMGFLVATMSLPAVYRLNDDARTTTAGTPHARANTREVNIETDIVAIIERTGIMYNGENGLSEFESESIQR